MRGPKEHHTRPAIDPLFRSAALSAGPAVIGVILTGMLDDGTAGLQAIKMCRGLAVVQSPDDAFCSDMPRSALRNVQVDHCVALSEMGPLLTALVSTEIEVKMDTPPPTELVLEQDLLMGRGDPLSNLRGIGRPSTFTCPDCHGTLWEMTGSQPARFICHTGHAYSLRTLQDAATVSTDEALWNALRSSQENGLLLRYQAERSKEEGDLAASARCEAAAAALERETALLREIVERQPVPP
jgi:two-component system chemotaxis response regulator CheB